MSRQKKIWVLLAIVMVVFFSAYGWHRYLGQKYSISGRLQNKEADEISGITASTINKDVYYAHNDSGDTSRIFAITTEGKILSTIYYNWQHTTQPGGHDCEDISTGPGPIKGADYIYIADIGDNFSARPFVTIYRLRDRPSFIIQKETHTKAVAINLIYPDGAKDAEAMMIDPVDELMYIVTKRYDSVSVYTAPLKYKPNDTLKLTKRCKLFFAGLKPLKWITAADISKDGKQVLVKNYQKVFYWKRQPGEAIWQTLQRKPLELPYQQEKLGEAIAFTPGGSGYFTTSEGAYAPIYYYKTPGFF
ncbi:DUF4131 domain-containing protein [Mucilaginibacter sp. UR6-1]|uniref:DUF4131 domain-containing protein n=1 Tax=Mucilaginibacter sp. UR6-1 TaxID=1435643 RepID=UPI001E5E3200|nr:DUF4131 domain-containing protein [Mucilaginibacter sp. UR6-1]MCC8408858.1 DUF4131 domain-containing protein [Mucilaginibacter sp. UR6-1]